jgi:NADH-quinone oxidoreductase subunit G
VSADAQRVADDLLAATRAVIWLGNLAEQHPRFAELELLATALAEVCGAQVGRTGMAANSVGAAIAGAEPGAGGLDARRMFESPRRAYLLLGVEPELDCADGAAALAALRQARFVVAMSPFEHGALDYAHVILPVAPFSETAGTFVNAEGRAQRFTAVVRPLGDTRPGWKVLRVLGNLLGLSGFDQESAEAVRAGLDLDAQPLAGCDSTLRPEAWSRIDLDAAAPVPTDTIERIGPVRIHDADALARRAAALQATRDAGPPEAALAADVWARLALVPGDRVRVRAAGAGEGVVLPALRDPRLAHGCVMVPSGTPQTLALGPAFGTLVVERIAAASPAAAATVG